MNERPVIKRKFAYIGAGWAAGLLIFLFMGTAAAVCIPLSLAAVSAVFVKRSESEELSAAGRYVQLAAVSALAGGLFFMGFEGSVYSPLRALDGKTVTIEGTVHDTYTLPWGDTRLTLKGRANGIRTKASVITKGEFSCGDRITAEIKASELGGTDSEDTYRSLGIFISGKGTAVKTGERDFVVYHVRALRERALAGIYENCGGQSGAFIASVLCSDKSHLSPETRRAVNRAGIGHIFAVSGTHVVMLTYFMSWILRRFVSSFRLRNALLGIIIVLFAIFAGANVPVVRACIMLGISLTAVIFERESDSANSLGLAVFIVTLMNPYAVSSVSFLLSFTAAAAFGVLSPAITEGRTEHPMIKLVISCLCVNILTLPICALSFDEVSVMSAVSNIVLIPVCSLCLYIAFLFTLTGGLTAPLILAADIIAGAVVKLCELAAASPYSYASTENKWLLAAWGIAGSALFILCASVKKRRPSDLAKCSAAYLLVYTLAAVM